jgi:hypothetical protein
VKDERGKLKNWETEKLRNREIQQARDPEK